MSVPRGGDPDVMAMLMRVLVGVVVWTGGFVRRGRGRPVGSPEKWQVHMADGGGTILLSLPIRKKECSQLDQYMHF